MLGRSPSQLWSPSNYNLFYITCIRLSQILIGQEFGSQISLPDRIVDEVIEVDELDKGDISAKLENKTNNGRLS